MKVIIIECDARPPRTIDIPKWDWDLYCNILKCDCVAELPVNIEGKYFTLTFNANFKTPLNKKLESVRFFNGWDTKQNSIGGPVLISGLTQKREGKLMPRSLTDEEINTLKFFIRFDKQTHLWVLNCPPQPYEMFMKPDPEWMDEIYAGPDRLHL